MGHLPDLACWSDDIRIKEIPRNIVYNLVPSIPLDEEIGTRETQDLADTLFYEIQSAPGYKRRNESQKRRHWHALFHASTLAVYANGCIRYSRRRTDIPKAKLQVIECAVRAGLFFEHRSPSGSPRQSRLLPLTRLRRAVLREPQMFDPTPRGESLVQLYTREETPVPIKFNPDHPIAAETQSRLERVNAANSQYVITCEPDDPYIRDREPVRRLQPIHRARFTGSWELHGRLYTDKYGHQSLKKFERGTIRFNGEPSVELDYSGMHCRLLYHLLNLEYVNDPYFLWGPHTTGSQRLLAKAVVNATINAPTPRSAVAACNSQARVNTSAGSRKTGKLLERALVLRDARRETGLTFKSIQARALDFHRPISEYFGCDMGMQLMRLDSIICLDVLSHFADKGIPALGVHDSFLVPSHHEDELRWAMDHYYYRRMGHRPVISMAHTSSHAMAA